MVNQNEHTVSLEATDAVNLVLQANGDNTMGKTALQKLIYFVSKQVTNSRIDFVPYHYGPYSARVAATLAELYSSDRVLEIQEFVNEHPIYRYRLTLAGKAHAETIRNLHPSQTISVIQNIVNICTSVCNLNANMLGCAAKVDYVCRNCSSHKSSYEKILKDAKEFGWFMTINDVKNGLKVLEPLQLRPTQC